MESKGKDQQLRGYLMILTAGILWGSIGFFSSTLQSQGAESATVAFLRIFVGMLLLIPLMLAMGGKRLFLIDRRGLLTCAVLGLLCQAVFNVSYTESISHVGVATASVLLYTSPIFVCVMSKLCFKETIGPVKLLALAINILGSVLTVTGGDFSSVKFSVYGVAAGVLAGFLYALMTIISTTTGKYNSLTILFYSFLFGSIALAAAGHPWTNIAQSFSLPFFAAAVGYGLIPTVGSYFFYMKGLARNLETSKVPVIASVETVVAAIIGIFVFREEAGLWKLAGIICALCSIAIMNMAKSKKAPA